MLHEWLLLVFAQHVIASQIPDEHLRKIASAYTSWAVASPYNPHVTPFKNKERPIRQFTHMVTVQPPQPRPIPVREPLQHSKPRFLHIPVAPSEPQVQRIQPQPVQTITPQYIPQPKPLYSPQVSLPYSPLHSPNATYLLPQKIRKPMISDEDEARRAATRKQKWGRPTFEFTCEFGYCSGGCCSPRKPLHPPPQIHATALPGSNLQHPVMVVLHPSPPQCSPACQPMCLPQCTTRLQYGAMPMPEFFHHPQQPTCRFDCMPSCHVDCLIMPPMIIRCTSFPCQCGPGYQQCTPFSCCSGYMNLRSKFRSMVEDKSSEEVEVTKKRKKLRTPLHIPFHGTTGRSVISGDSERITTTPTPTTTALSTTTASTTTEAPTTTSTSTTTTTTTIASSPSTTGWPEATTTVKSIKPIYPEIPLIPVYELWQPKEQILKASSLEEADNFIRSNSFVEMLTELASVKSKSDLDMTPTDFLNYLTETGK